MSKTKTTEEIRSLFTDGDFWDGSDFDAWLTQHDAEITAQVKARIIKLLEDAEVLCTETTTCYDFDADGVCDCAEFRSLVEGK